MQMYHAITNAMTLGPNEVAEPPAPYSNPAPQMVQNRRSSKRKDGGSLADIDGHS